MGKIVVDRGLEQYTIEDKNGTVLGKFEMNPADVELVKRYEHVAEAVSHIADNVDERKDIVDIVKEMEEDILEKINNMGIGPAGLGGRITALAVNIETYPTHIAGLPVAVNMCCHVNRHKSRII